MFSRLSNLIFTGALACMLSACGGGQADDTNGAAAAPFASAAAPVASLAGATATAAPVGSSAVPVVPSAPASPAPSSAPAAPAPDVQFAYTAPVAVQSPVQAELQTATVYGGGSSVMSPQSQAAQAALAAAQRARMAELAAAQDAARWQAAMGNSDDEAFLALIMYHENAERQAAVTGLRYRKPSDADCSSPRLMMCAGN